MAAPPFSTFFPLLSFFAVLANVLGEKKIGEAAHRVGHCTRGLTTLYARARWSSGQKFYHQVIMFYRITRTNRTAGVVTRNGTAASASQRSGASAADKARHAIIAASQDFIDFQIDFFLVVVRMVALESTLAPFLLQPLPARDEVVSKEGTTLRPRREIAKHGKRDDRSWTSEGYCPIQSKPQNTVNIQYVHDFPGVCLISDREQ